MCLRNAYAILNAVEREWLLGFRCSSLLGCGCCIWLVAVGANGLFPEARVHVVGPLGGLPAVVDGLQVLAVQFRLVMGVGMGVTTCGVQHKVQLAAHSTRTQNKSVVTFLAHTTTTVTMITLIIICQRQTSRQSNLLFKEQ